MFTVHRSTILQRGEEDDKEMESVYEKGFRGNIERTLPQTKNFVGLTLRDSEVLQGVYDRLQTIGIKVFKER